MVEFIKENGSKTKCKVTVFLLGLMAESTKENTIMIRNTDLELSHGQMDELTMEGGEMENSMEMVSI